VQTISRAKRVYEEECLKWHELFMSISVDYFGKRYVEIDRLQAALESKLQHIEFDSRQKLYFLLSDNGDEIIEKTQFEKVMGVWSTFTCNDINNDNELDVNEIKMMWWLLDGKKPINAKLEREIRIMDSDGNGTIDRLEWLSYLCSPKVPGQETLGSKDYYDFELRENFEQADSDKDGLINQKDIISLIKN